MRKLLITTCCLTLAAPLFADGTNQLADEKSRVSYALGLSVGHNFKSQGLTASELDPAQLAKGINDVLAGGNEDLTQAQVQETLMTFQREFRARMISKNKADGAAFLATNKLAAGVQTLAVVAGGQTNELQYLVVTNGAGPVPKDTDKVSVNYRGTLLNGTEFDSSYKRGQPTSFPVNGVIKGWTEALKRMPVGSKWKLFIPGELAYGDNGTRGIPPNSTLIFEVELLAIEATPAPPAPPLPLTSDIVKVPSAEDMKKGAKVETIKAEDLQKAQMEAQQQQQQKQ